MLRLVEGRNGFHLNILRLEVLVKTGSRRPGTRGFDCCEKFIKRQLNRRTDDVELIGIVDCQTFSEADGIGTRWGGMVEGTGIKVVREEGWETEGGRGLVVLMDNWFSGVGSLAAALGQGGFFIVIIRNVVGDRGSSAAGRLVKLGGGLQVWFLDWTRHGGGGWLVDAERKLHALDGARSTVKASLAVALLFSSTLSDHISGMVPFESRSLELNNAPAKATSQQTARKRKRDITCLPFSLSSLSPMCLESRLNSRLERALSESTIRFWRCHSLQLRFSSLCPCSRKLATLVQT